MRGEQPDERIGTFGQDDPATGLPGQRRLDHSLNQAALGKVVRRRDQAVAGRGDEDLAE